jgi:hypothetical protein
LLATAALCIALVPASVIIPAMPAAAQNADDYQAELERLKAEMEALRAEVEAFKPLGDYCPPKNSQLKQQHQDQMAEWVRKAKALNDATVSARNLFNAKKTTGSDGRDAELSDTSSYERARRTLSAAVGSKQRQLDAALKVKCGGAVPQPPTKIGTTGGTGPITTQPPSTPQGPSYAEPTPPVYQPVSMPSLPQRFCSDKEKRDLLAAITSEQEKVNNNSKLAMAFSTNVNFTILAVEQAGQQVPTRLRELQRRAESELREHERIFDEGTQRHARASAMRVFDCEAALQPPKEDILEETGGMLQPIEPKEDILSETEDLNEAKWRDRSAPRARMPSALDAAIEAAVRKHEEARKRCDNQGMKAALAELRALYQEAQRLAADVQEAGEFSTVPLNDARDVRYRAEKALERAEMLSPSECLESGAQYILDGPKVSYGESRQERAARLAAIQQLRTGQAGASGTEVQFAFPGGSDLSGRTRADVENRIRDVEYVRKEERRQDAGGHSQPKETVQPPMPVERMPEPPVREPQAPLEEVERSPWTPPEELERIPSMPPQELERLPATPISSAPPPELERPPVAKGSTMLLADVDAPPSTGMSTGPYSVRLPGTWRVANPALGLRQVNIANQGSGVVLSGSGGAIRLERNGNSYVGSGSLMPGRGSQPIRLQVQGNQVQLRTRNDGGESVAATLVQ